MKAIIVSKVILFFSALSISISTVSEESCLQLNRAAASEILIFDGFEGGYLFFTNIELQAVVLELENERILKSIDIINGDYVGEKFKVSFTPIKPSQESSSIGVIDRLDVIK